MICFSFAKFLINITNSYIPEEVAISPLPRPETPEFNTFTDSEEEEIEDEEEYDITDNEENGVDEMEMPLVGNGWVVDSDEDDVVPQMPIDQHEPTLLGEEDAMVPQVEGVNVGSEDSEEGNGNDGNDNGHNEGSEDGGQATAPSSPMVQVPLSTNIPTTQTTGTMEAGPSEPSRAGWMRKRVLTLEAAMGEKEESESRQRLRTEDYMKEAHRWAHAFQQTTCYYRRTITLASFDFEEIKDNMEPGPLREKMVEALTKFDHDMGYSWDYERDASKWARTGR